MGVPEQVELLKVKSITGTIEVHSIFDKTGISTRLKSLPIPLRNEKLKIELENFARNLAI
jgi:hypothetical protein